MKTNLTKRESPLQNKKGVTKFLQYKETSNVYKLILRRTTNIEDYTNGTNPKRVKEVTDPNIENGLKSSRIGNKEVHKKEEGKKEESILYNHCVSSLKKIFFCKSVKGPLYN